jgi:hypothetical protein
MLPHVLNYLHMYYYKINSEVAQTSGKEVMQLQCACGSNAT